MTVIPVQKCDIDYTLIYYQAALIDWENPVSVENGTEYGFCHYFPHKMCMEYNMENFPELFSIGARSDALDIFYQFTGTGNSETGRSERVRALRTAIYYRELKKDHVTLPNHYTTRNISTLFDLESVLESYPSIFVAPWGKLMSSQFFYGKHWTDEAKRKYLESQAFWVAEKRDSFHVIGKRFAHFWNGPNPMFTNKMYGDEANAKIQKPFNRWLTDRRQ